MYKSLPFFAAIFATIHGLSLEESSTSSSHSSKTYSEGNKTTLTASIDDSAEMLARIEFLEDIFEEFNQFVDDLELVEDDGDEYDYWITYELPFYLDELNWGLEALIQGVNDGLATTDEIW